jgi:hypothetical protein
MKPVVAIDVLLCTRCGGRRRVVAVYPAGPRLRDLLDRSSSASFRASRHPTESRLSPRAPDQPSALTIGAAPLAASALPRLLPAPHRHQTAQPPPPGCESGAVPVAAQRHARVSGSASGGIQWLLSRRLAGPIQRVLPSRWLLTVILPR